MDDLLTHSLVVTYETDSDLRNLYQILISVLFFLLVFFLLQFELFDVVFETEYEPHFADYFSLLVSHEYSLCVEDCFHVIKDLRVTGDTFVLRNALIELYSDLDFV